MTDTAVAAAVPADDQTDNSSRLAKIGLAALAAFTLLFALALVLTYSMLHSQITDKGSRVKALQADLAASNQKLVRLRGDVDKNAAALKAAGAQQVSALQDKLTTANARITQIANCLPELQNELNGQTVQTAETNGWLTNAYLTNGVQVSRVCAKTLYGTSTVSGD